MSLRSMSTAELVAAAGLEHKSAVTKIERIMRSVRRLRDELDEHETIATLAHRLIEAWDSGEVDFTARTVEHEATIREAIRQMRRFCAEHPEETKNAT